MTPGPPSPNEPLADDDPELGQPIQELSDLSASVPATLMARVHGSIERRRLTGEFLGLWWAAPLLVVLELLRWPFELLAGPREPTGDARGGPGGGNSIT